VLRVNTTGVHQSLQAENPFQQKEVPMFTLKTPNMESIQSALQKAERYRLLNEPREAESISLDILQVDPDNQEALIMLILAHTDMFKTEFNPAFNNALSVIEQLHDEHYKTYYRGIIFERRAKAHLSRSEPSSNNMAYDFFIKAMAEYEQILESNPDSTQDAALRWNTCARVLNESSNLKPTDQNLEVELTDSYE
jgi:tetratricopeptide (TPR) repeat protein